MKDTCLQHLLPFYSECVLIETYRMDEYRPRNRIIRQFKQSLYILVTLEILFKKKIADLAASRFLNQGENSFYVQIALRKVKILIERIRKLQCHVR